MAASAQADQLELDVVGIPEDENSEALDVGDGRLGHFEFAEVRRPVVQLGPVGDPKLT